MKKLRLYRLIRGWTQIDLAAKSGIPVGRIHLIETGRVSLTSSDLHRLSNAIGVRADELTGGVDENSLSALKKTEFQ